MVERDVNARLRSVLRLTAVGATVAFLAGCSSDVGRLSSGPFGPADNTPTASIGSRTLTPPEAISGAPATAANSAGTWGSAPSYPTAAIQSAPLAPLAAPLAAPVAAAAVSRPSTQAVTSAATSAARTAGGSFGPWTTAGGSAVTVAQGESASVLAARYGVPMEALVKANGLSSASQVTPGKSLVIPVYNAAGRQASSALPSSTAVMATAGVATAAVGAGALAKGALSAPKSVAGAAKTAVGSTKTAASGAKTLASATTARVVTDPAKSTATAAKTQVSRVVEPARKPEQNVAEAVDISKQRAAETAKETAKKKEAAKVELAKVKEAKAKETKAKETKAKEVAAQKPAPAAEPERKQVAAAPAAAAAPAVDKPEFRWPARGRIIQGFKSGTNDGIAIAVPEGTAVKAAEGGVVAYAGSELKGYGNLVLIRHTNGFVSAYAHNGELNVKRGESVKRGQTIAKSGQSGNVSAPQLHFELRKGSTPVDPTQYLAGL